MYHRKRPASLLWIQSLLFVPDGIRIGFEVDCAAGIFPPLKNVNYCVAVPPTRILRDSIGKIPPMTFLICRWGQHLFRFQLVGNLRWATPFHAQVKDVFYNLGGFRVNDPVLGIFRVFHITVWSIGGQRNAPLALRPVDGTDFPAGVTGVKLVEPVLDSGEVIVDTVGIGGIEIVIDGDEANAVLREGEVGVQSGQCGVSAQSGKVFAEDNPHLAGFHLFQHTLKAGTVIIRAAETVIHEEYRIREMMLFCILQKDGFLRGDLSRVFSAQKTEQGYDYAA